jgi:hypothetical protein
LIQSWPPPAHRCARRPPLSGTAPGTRTRSSLMLLWAVRWRGPGPDAAIAAASPGVSAGGRQTKSCAVGCKCGTGVRCMQARCLHAHGRTQTYYDRRAARSPGSTPAIAWHLPNSIRDVCWRQITALLTSTVYIHAPHGHTAGLISSCSDAHFACPGALLALYLRVLWGLRCGVGPSDAKWYSSGGSESKLRRFDLEWRWCVSEGAGRSAGRGPLRAHSHVFCD